MADGPEDKELIEREASGTAVVGYAFVKYSAFVIITIAILYFLARWVLPRF